ncbi:hypothetical protein H6F42_17345 [Pseudanabaena sp. FACHB-1998]|uniref:hypothetical protein n=1 Tax=Pseudanabaena sp. FACHB-1998 TaxID=2692858 RepID=UPI0016815471|nr:hypothetical protein [Pseudanabaena sp. FACHB-1998]MBD2178687.1 hypothetical protein [Pseudanabaena sp. FACHB-1998]
MQKLILSFLITGFSIAIAATTAVTSIEAQSTDEYLDSTSPQVIEKIDGNIVTFKNVSGESHNYYVPSWMFSKYNLQVGTSANLYNRNIVQGIYRDRYIEGTSSSLMNGDSFALNDSRSDCLISQRYGTEDLSSGKRVWFKTKDCPSTIPIVGSMSFFQPKTVSSVVPDDSSASLPSNSSTIPISTPTSIPDSTQPPIEQMPVQGLW